MLTLAGVYNTGNYINYNYRGVKLYVEGCLCRFEPKLYFGGC